ncbi:MAG TPA: CehA/McbA family metallohydrolase [Labilithrix sp.]
MRPRSSAARRSRWLVACAVLLVPATAIAAPDKVVDGAVPTGGPDHFFVPFDVPDGTTEIQIVHSDESDANILDFGLYDQDGYRGWGGGTTETTIVGELAASRAYVAGPIKPGPWQVVVGKAKIVASPAVYHLEISFLTAPTLPPFTDRRPYAPAPARKTGTRYYAGDFHCHSRESTDATPPLQDMIALAKSRGLEFMEVSDHNTVTQMDLFGAIQDTLPDFLLVPGVEFTTYAGHANAIGATKWVDHKIGQPGVTIDGAADQIAAQGAIFSINHPALDVGNLCIGCAWKHDIDPSKVFGVEIETGGYDETGGLFTANAIKFWEGFLDKGRKIPAMGGSDDHNAGQMTSMAAESPIGDPTTMVRATELSVAALLDGIRKGATVVKLGGPTDPMAELEAAPARDADAIGWPGDTLGVRRVFLRVKVTGGNGDVLRLVKNGSPQPDVPITSDPFVYADLVDAPVSGEDRWRAEVTIDDKPRTVTSHLWLRSDPNGIAASDDGGSGGGCVVSRETPSWPIAFGASIVVLALVRRRRAA